MVQKVFLTVRTPEPYVQQAYAEYKGGFGVNACLPEDYWGKILGWEEHGMDLI